jgi:ADP-heptose:LPS heptosyltransferase
MENTGLPDEVIDVHSRSGQLLLSLKNRAKYDLAVLNYFAFNRRNLLLATALAAEIVTNRKPEDFLARRLSRKLKFVTPRPRMHDALQNLLLIGEEKFELNDLAIPVAPAPPFDLPEKYIALQVSSGNPQILYKNWPLENWETFLAEIARQDDTVRFVLLGNGHDLPLAARLQQKLGKNLISLAGKTSITQAMQVLSHSRLFIGPDSGLMHLAVAYGKPTFTLWGASSEQLYGYEQFDARLHRCVRAATDCYPCNAWIGANQRRTKSPEDCPDFACMKQLPAAEVSGQYFKFVSSLPQDVR